MSEMTKGEFAAAYGRMMADFKTDRDKSFSNRRCQDCQHNSYLYGCYCESRGCRCRVHAIRVATGQIKP